MSLKTYPVVRFMLMRLFSGKRPRCGLASWRNNRREPSLFLASRQRPLAGCSLVRRPQPRPAECGRLHQQRPTRRTFPSGGKQVFSERNWVPGQLAPGFGIFKHTHARTLLTQTNTHTYTKCVEIHTHICAWGSCIDMFMYVYGHAHMCFFVFLGK